MYGGVAMWVLPRFGAMAETTKTQHLIMPRITNKLSEVMPGNFVVISEAINDSYNNEC